MNEIDIPELKRHPLSDAFPSMSEEEFEELKKDIARNGLQMPIVLCPQGTVLDGWHRYQACKEMGVPLMIEQIKDPNAPLVDIVSSLNLHRRHLSASQRAAIAASLAEYRMNMATDADEPKGLKAEKLKEKPGHGLIREAAGELNVSDEYARQAAELKARRPDLFEQVRSGQMSLSRAMKEAESDDFIGAGAGAFRKLNKRELTDTARDGKKTEELIPPDVLAAMEDRRTLNEIIRNINELRRAIKAMAGRPGTAWIDCDDVMADLNHAKEVIRNGRPYRVCPVCDGSHCDACKRSGFMPKDVWQMHNEE